MDDLFEFIETIVEFISGIVEAVLMFVSMLNTVTSIVGRGLVYLMTTINFLPSFIIPFAAITVSVSVIYVILGRNMGR